MNQPPPRKARTRRLILFVALLILSAYGWARLSLALSSADLLARLGAQPGPAYLAASGAVWGTLALVAALLLYLPRPAGARWVSFTLTALLAVLYWGDLLWLTRPAEVLVNAPFLAGASLIGLLYAFWVARNG